MKLQLSRQCNVYRAVAWVTRVAVKHLPLDKPDEQTGVIWAHFRPHSQPHPQPVESSHGQITNSSSQSLALCYIGVPL